MTVVAASVGAAGVGVGETLAVPELAVTGGAAVPPGATGLSFSSFQGHQGWLLTMVTNHIWLDGSMVTK